MAAIRRTLTEMGRVPAQPFDLSFLQRAQQLGLQVERQFANFVEKERALVGQFQAAHLARNRAGECALLVPEQFALQQSGGDGRTVDLDEGAITASAEAVNGARQQFLAGSGLALDEYGRVGGCDGLNLLEHLAQTAAFAHDVFKSILEVDFVFEILLFLAKAVAQFRDLAKDHRIPDSHGHLVGDLDEHVGFALGKCTFDPAGYSERHRSPGRDE